MSGHCEICGQTGCVDCEPTPATGGEVVAKDAAAHDAMMYGQGFMLRNADGSEQHIPVDEVIVKVEVPRFQPDWTLGCMDEETDGDYVYADDYQSLASALEAVREERDAAKPAAEWMRRTAVRLAVADEGDSLLVLARGLTGWVDRARATFDEYQDRALKAERERDALMKLVAVDAEKVMALVNEYGYARWEQGDNFAREGCRPASDECRIEAEAIRDRIRALLTPANNGWQPIETAPRKHGERILLWRDCWPNTLGSYVIGFAIDGDSDWHSNECKGLRSLESYGYRVTHWQPLPSPPAIASQESAGEAVAMVARHAYDSLYADAEAIYEKNATLRAELAEVANALPGPYYMDPPDGGDVSIGEQVQRMADDVAALRARLEQVEGAAKPIADLLHVNANGVRVLVFPTVEQVEALQAAIAAGGGK